MRPRAALLLVAMVACGGPGSSTPRVQGDSMGPVPTDPRQNDPTGNVPVAQMDPVNPAGAAKKAPFAAKTPATAGSAAASSEPPDASASPPNDGKPDAVPEKISARHVLIQYMGAERASGAVVRTREQALAVAQAVLKLARAGQDMGRLAVEYSDEAGSASRGGSLGRFGHGMMVPAFEEAAFKLKVGQISDIVESSFGFHIIQRTD